MVLRLISALALVVACFVPLSAPRAQPYGGGEAVECVSRNFAYTRCNVPWHDARIVQRLSDTECRRGQNWGIDRGGLWVDRGCGARFVAAAWRPSP